MVENKGGPFAPCVRSQEGGGAYVDHYSTMTVANGSSINGNTATKVSSPAFVFALGSWLVRQVTNRRSIAAERETSRRSSMKETLRSRARPPARRPEEAPT